MCCCEEEEGEEDMLLLGMVLSDSVMSRISLIFGRGLLTSLCEYVEIDSSNICFDGISRTLGNDFFK